MSIKEVIRQDFVKVDRSETISELITALHKSDDSAALIFDDDKLLGVSTKDFLIRTRLDVSKAHAGKVLLRVPFLDGSEDLRETARLFYTSNSPILPVVKGKILKGVVKRIDIVKKLKDTWVGDMKAGDMPSKEMVTLWPESTVGDAIAMMKEHKVSRLPVVDEKGRLAGIAGDSDIMEYHLHTQKRSELRARAGKPAVSPRETKAFLGNRTRAKDYLISNLASSEVITSCPEDELKYVISIMENQGFSSIVIVEKNKPLGIITERDLLKLFLKA